MKVRFVVILAVILLVPLVLAFFLGFRIIGREQQAVKEQFLDVLYSRLADTDLGIRNLTLEYERWFLGKVELAGMTTDEVRRFIHNERRVRQVFILAADGKLLYPPAPAYRTTAEQDFFTRTEFIWKDKESFYKPRQDSNSRVQTSGWYTWFWGKGLNLIYWMLGDSGRITGIEVDSAALAADIIGALPGTDAAVSAPAQARIVLAGIGGTVIYQWGTYQPAAGEKPAASIPVSPPLASWSLEYYLDRNELNRMLGSSAQVSLAAGGLVLLAVLAGLAVYFFRENSRAIREAGRKVTFVNQVSHELKTPLTNIRLYAELLESRLQPGEEQVNRYLQVIVSESRRLSRLILNVLTFARDGKEKTTLRKTAGVIDEVIHEVIGNFRQPFAVCGIEVHFNGNAGQVVSFDHDCLRQILGNLFNNVEKYAAGGKEIRVASRNEDCRSIITVTDKGPGIPGPEQEKIFKPFTRLNNKLSAGVSGTGLGLTIARRLAQLHGGNVEMMPVTAGAGFKVSLETPACRVPGSGKEETGDDTDCRG